MSKPLPRIWADTVRRAPTALALVDAASGKRWSRSALSEAAGAWAGSFAREAGKTTQLRRRVAMSVPNGAEWFHVFLGLMSAGAVPVPIDPSEPEEAQLAVARAIGATFLWREGRLCRLAGYAKHTPGPPGECLIKLTSGTSGISKALPVTHAQMSADGRQICRTMGIAPEDINLAAIPLGYSYGLGNLVMPLITQGTSVICISSALPHAIASDAATHKPTVFPAVPPLLRAIAASEVAPGSFASLRVVISAGSALDPEVARSFDAKFGVRVHGFYGTSETGGIAYDRSGDATLAGRSVGAPMAGVRLAFGAAGRFTVTSPSVVGVGRFSPGDRAALNEHGELVLRGRTDRTVKVGGRRVDLAEIEKALRSLPGVRDAFAHMADGPDAALAAAAATDLSVAEVRRLLRARVAAWKVPPRIIVLREFPSTSRGKADGRRLRQILSAERTATSISTFKAARQISAPR
jgi:long-chain acyl-CoA synthetase